MRRILVECQLLSGLEELHIARLEHLMIQRRLAPGERLFDLGMQADHTFVVLEGSIELCMPLTIGDAVREIAIDSAGPGATLGWSAFVKPYRFRLSARVTAPTSVAAFERLALLRMIKDDPAFGCVILGRIAEIISKRLLTFQALWARDLQSTIAEDARFPPPG